MFREVLFNAATYKVLGSKKLATHVMYVVTDYPDEKGRWHVAYGQNGNLFRCACKRLESYGLPCVHIIVVVMKLNITELPKSIVLSRWTKAAKDGLYQYGSGGEVSGGDSELTRFTAWLHTCRQMCSLAANSLELFNEITDKVLVETESLQGRLIQHSDEIRRTGEAVDGVVSDPKIVRTKGCGAGPSANERKRKQKCSKCRMEGHNRSTCELKGNAMDEEDITEDDFDRGQQASEGVI
ncbi:hypothetical protein RIF29_30897 [Crotalaria pallida]|uniref:Protein FAR1-RELATED SEQUENCE n=1 Tax=Crotalaria pallida TaxID=3830 RepID=A0AAN9HYI0_CROPI